jgi:hypothetical protein
MDKWADYCISSVRYTTERAYIIKVKVHIDNGDTVGNAKEWTRNEVASAIGEGKTFVTITQDSNNTWAKGQDVHIVLINNVKYIRTDKNNRASDNLENLPEF